MKLVRSRAEPEGKAKKTSKHVVQEHEVLPTVAPKKGKPVKASAKADPPVAVKASIKVTVPKEKAPNHGPLRRSPWRSRLPLKQRIRRINPPRRSLPYPPEVAKAEGSGKAKSAHEQPVAKVVVAPEPEHASVADKHVADKPASPPVKASKPSDDVTEVTVVQDPPVVTGEVEPPSAEESIEAVEDESPRSVSPVDPALSWRGS